MTTIDPKAPILVTGATGYIAGVLVRRLLEAGHTVHAAVRDPDNATKRAHLDGVAAGAPGDLRYFKADLLEVGSYAKAMEGCELVYHTASPFFLDVTDPLKQLVEPAKLGTRNVLEQASATTTVKRVVITSSVAAIYSDNADVASAPNGVLTEEIWNTTSSLEHQPYNYSKTLAEQEAWKLHKAQSQWDLVTINPSMVMGPGVAIHKSSESLHLFKQLADGTMKTGMPRFGMGLVDVRDVAEAHYLAGFTPTAAGRYIVSGHNSDLADFAAVLYPHYGDRFPIPTRTLPKWLVWLFGPLTNPALNRRTISLNVGLPFKADHSKSVRELGLTYRPLEETLVDFFEQLVAEGVLVGKAST